jgi:branched-chain amino acid transport system substrate-binding protein
LDLEAPELKPQTIALVGADAEYPRHAIAGARELVKKFGFKTVYDKSYPPSTVDYTPIARAIKAVNPDVVFVASYPPDSVGMVRAAYEIGLQPKIFGGGMVGLQFTTVMTSLGPMLNGIVNYDFWAPEQTMMFPGIKEFFAEYQKRAKEAGVDTLGYYLPPYAYSAVQILGLAIEGSKSLEGRRLHPHQLTVLMAEQNFNQATKIADRGYIIVHGRIEFEGRSTLELRENELVKKYYLGV